MGTPTLGFLVHKTTWFTSLRFTNITAAPHTTSLGCHHHHLPCTSTSSNCCHHLTTTAFHWSPLLRHHFLRPISTSTTTVSKSHQLKKEEEGTRILSNLTNLEELDLSQNNLGNEFDGLNNLKELDLSGNAIASISALNGSQEESGILKKLEVLDLSSNDFDNSVWSFLGGLSSIKTLDLRYNYGLHGTVHNKDLRNLRNIETLLMNGVIFDDVLPYIRVMTSIQVLSLAGSESKHISSIEVQCSVLVCSDSLSWLPIGASTSGSVLNHQSSVPKTAS